MHLVNPEALECQYLLTASREVWNVIEEIIKSNSIAYFPNHLHKMQDRNLTLRFNWSQIVLKLGGGESYKFMLLIIAEKIVMQDICPNIYKQVVDNTIKLYG